MAMLSSCQWNKSLQLATVSSWSVCLVNFCSFSEEYDGWEN